MPQNARRVAVAGAPVVRHAGSRELPTSENLPRTHQPQFHELKLGAAKPAFSFSAFSHFTARRRRRNRRGVPVFLLFRTALAALAPVGAPP
jgi:hypothetical protein